MKVNAILKPLTGEHVVGVYPTMKPEVEADWRRRLNFYTGRSLSDVALGAEQEGRAGRLATRGEMVSPGVVTGLEVGVEQEDESDARFFYYIASGMGITASGEDVVVSRPLRVDVKAVSVYAPAAILSGNEAEEEADSLEVIVPGGLQARRLGPSLNELIEAGVALPPAGILVLQPVVVGRIGKFDPRDPCETDPQNNAFDDWQLVDGCRLIFYAWPTDWLFLPELGEQWRNRIAHTIFEAEKDKDSEHVLPWEEIGVPIGLVGFNASWIPLFVDRYSVVRAGGKPKQRSVLVPGAGSPFLWQSRMQQFAEQVAEKMSANVAVEQLYRQFRYLPPAGLLPGEAIAPRKAQDHFFPSNYYVKAMPVPLEQLDVAMESSASLAPFDTSTPDRVCILVPVPQVWYEPELLRKEIVDPEFQQTIDEFVERRAKWLKRRQDVREIAEAIIRAIKGEPPVYPDPDPDALEEEDVASDPLDPEDPKLADPEETYGTEVKDGKKVTTGIETLRTYLRKNMPLKHETAVSVETLPEDIAFPEGLSDKIAYDKKRKLLIVQGVMTDKESKILLKFLESLELSGAKEIVERLYRESQKEELSQLDKLGLERFIGFLEDKIKRADDKIDFGFLRVQTDIYRVRQLMLGNVAGTRLATSPVLASIAKGESSAATREDLSAFMKGLEKVSHTDPVRSGTPFNNPGGSSGNPSRSANPGASGRNSAMAGDLFVSGELTGSMTEMGSLTRADSGETMFIKSGDIKEARTATTTEALTAKTRGDGVLFGSKPPTKDHVIGESSIIGNTYDFRNVTIADRLGNPPANEAKDAGVVSKYEVVKGFLDLELNVDDLQVPGFLEAEKDVKKSFGDIKSGGLVDEILSGTHDPNPDDDEDEAGFFAAGVKALENTVATLRVVEGRIHAYRRAVVRCRKTLNDLSKSAVKADHRLKVIGDELAEVRHDVAVARALLAEEEDRVAAINKRRDQIIAEHVPFLAFYRPRVSDLLLDAPVRAIDPGLVEAPVPACLARAVSIPSELRDMIDLFREVPVKWLTKVPSLLDKLDRLDVLHETIVSAKRRAQIKYIAKQPSYKMIAKQPCETLKASKCYLGQAISKAFTAQQQVVMQCRATTAQLDLEIFAGKSWKRTRDQVKEAISMGDLVDAGHGRSDVAQGATRELDNIAHVAACLYSMFGEVVPSIRLDWAERLSQYDAPVNLRNLSSLPGWGEIEYLDRRQIQTLVDWLYQRVDVRWPEAVSMMSDLVRICILLASHAPVNRIIAGHVQEATTAKEGAQVKVAIDPARVRVGMPVLMYAGSKVVAQGVVEDISAGQAAARVVKAMTETVHLEQGACVQFGEETAFYTNPLTRGKVWGGFGNS